MWPSASLVNVSERFHWELNAKVKATLSSAWGPFQRLPYYDNAYGNTTAYSGCQTDLSHQPNIRKTECICPSFGLGIAAVFVQMYLTGLQVRSVNHGTILYSCFEALILRKLTTAINKIPNHCSSQCLSLLVMYFVLPVRLSWIQTSPCECFPCRSQTSILFPSEHIALIVAAHTKSDISLQSISEHKTDNLHLPWTQHSVYEKLKWPWSLPQRTLILRWWLLYRCPSCLTQKWSLLQRGLIFSQNSCKTVRSYCATRKWNHCQFTWVSAVLWQFSSCACRRGRNVFERMREQLGTRTARASPQ